MYLSHTKYKVMAHQKDNYTTFSSKLFKEKKKHFNLTKIFNITQILFYRTIESFWLYHRKVEVISTNVIASKCIKM